MPINLSGSNLRSLVGLLSLPNMLLLFGSLLRDRRVPWYMKLFASAGLIYIFSPLDIIPDFTGIGLLDDLIVALVMMQAFIEMTPREIIDEHCRRLRIDPDKLMVDVPGTVSGAIQLALSLLALTKNRPAAPADPAAPDDGSAEGKARNLAVAEPPKPDGYKRYSAYNKEQP